MIDPLHLPPDALAARGLMDIRLRLAWRKTLAARRAAHLRALAQRLVERGDDAPPLRADVVLLPLFAAPGAPMPEGPPPSAGSSADEPTAFGSVSGRCRPWTARPWAEREGRRMGWTIASVARPAFERLRAVACAGKGQGWQLRASSAPALLAYATQVEDEYRLPAQPALWLRKPHGRPKCWALGLWRAARAVPVEGWHCGPTGPAGMTFDLLQPPRSDGERRLHAIIARLGERRRLAWRTAQLSFDPQWPATDRLRVALEVDGPGAARVEGWIAGHRWLPVHAWPGISPLLAGPAQEAPDGPRLHRGHRPPRPAAV